LEQELCSIWKEVLKIEQIGIHDNFFRIGGDSIISIQMVSKARLKGIHFAVKDVFNHPTIAALASVAKTQEDILTFKPEQGAVTGDVPLTPIQHWFFKNNLEDRNHFNQAVLLQSPRKIDLSHLSQVFSLLLSHHDALRFRYHQERQGDWIQASVAELEPFSVQEIDFSHTLSEDQLAQNIEEHASLIQQTLNIEKGPLIQVVLFNCGKEKSQRLLIVIHHLVVDGVSWRILLEDLERLYSQLAKGETPFLLPKTHSYQQWAQSLKEYASSQTLQEEAPYWQKIVESTQPLPIDFDHGPATGKSARTVVLSLTEEETSLLLQRVPKAYRTQINDILLTALVLAIGDWTGKYALTLSLEGHGREDIIKDVDLSRTIGWFTSLFPVHLSLENPTDLGEAIKTVKENLRQLPHKGIGYGILSYLTHDKLDFSRSSYPSLSFNYLGQWDNTLTQEGLFTFSRESAGRSVSEQNKQAFLLDINGEVRQGALQLFWSYSTNHYHDHTIETLAQRFIDRLRSLIDYCCQDNVFGYTPSDFDFIPMDRLKLVQQIVKECENE
ncbi:MAG: non-ribosomal peptide synthetase, partial [Alphaproteobacteria bacterium]|nr:non-ribosomal peptide synthetase [Alphaproteobacteria bacterium]